MVLAAPARAEERPQLRYDTAIDGTVTIAGGVLWVASEILKGSLGPAECRWCDRNADGTDSLNELDAAARRALRSEAPHAPNLASNALGFVALPTLLLGSDALVARRDGRFSEWPADVLVISQAVVLAGDLNQLTKFVFARERPFVHALPPDQKGATTQPSDNNLSFYSGHTTLAFAFATATGTVATMRGYGAAPAIWAIGLPLAAFTGYLRIAADKHYLTDVITGALVGTAIGFGVPYVFHRPRADPSTGATASPLGVVSPMSFGGVF
jgi:membrane-associated phospholipid phosphatase